MKIFSILRFSILMALSLMILSCSEDSDDNNIINNNGGNNDNETYTAQERVITGTMKIRKIEGSEYAFTDWDRGEATLKIYIGVNDEDYKIGTGTVKSDGSVEFTLPASISGDHMTLGSLAFYSLNYSPSDLMVTVMPAKAYVTYTKDGESLERYTDCIVPSNDPYEYYSSQFFFNFYSADGSITGNIEGEEINMNCKKGWNITTYDKVNNKRIISEGLPSNAIFFCY